MKKLSFLSLVVLCVSLPGCLTTSPSSGTIGVNPDSVTVAAGTTQVFQPILTGSLSTADIKWVVTGTGCSGGSCGTIDINGIYTAPKTAPANPNIQVEAVDIFDPSKIGFANVTIGSAATVAITQPVANPSTVASTNTLVFGAKVSNTSNTAVTWSVAGTGCSGAACGTFSLAQTTNGTTTTYTAPNPLPAPPTVTVTATSVADPTQTAPLTVNLTLLVNVTPAAIDVNSFDTQQFSTQIFGLQGSPASTTTWTLSSTTANCAAATAPCGVISSTGLYQALGAIAVGTVVTVTASVSQAVANGPLAGSGTGTVTVSITISGADSQLVDHYAFFYRGYTVSGGTVTPFVEAGSLIFDGGGLIVAGSVEDDNNGSTPHSQQAVTGTYTFDVSDSMRGTITLTGGLVTKMRFVLVPNVATVATTVFLTDFGGATAGAGTMQQQDKTQFSNATFSGGTAAWAMQVRGNTNAPSAVGRFDVQNAGTNTINAELGRTFGSKTAFGDCGLTTSTITIPAYSNTNTGAISNVAPSGSGNATLVLSNVSVKGAAAASLTFSSYIVTGSKLFMVETDNTGFAFVGTAEKQQPSSGTSFTNADFSGVYSQSLRSLNGPGAGNVDHTAMRSPGTNVAGTIIVDFGEWGGNLDGNAGTDQILEGLDFEGSTAAFPGGYYSVQSNGLALAAACPGGFMPRYVMYLISPSRAYMWNIDSSSADLTVTNLADSIGEIDLQQPQPPTQVSSMGAVTYAVSFEGVEGNFLSNGHSPTGAIAASGVVEFDTPTAGQVTFILDISRGATNTGSTPLSAIGTYDFNCNNLAVDFDGCQLGTTEDLNWNYAAITFAANPPFPIPNHFWFVSANRLLFDYIDTPNNPTTATAPTNIGGLAVKNQ